MVGGCDDAALLLTAEARVDVSATVVDAAWFEAPAHLLAFAVGQHRLLAYHHSEMAMSALPSKADINGHLLHVG